jgi:hypothetical protein
VEPASQRQQISSKHLRRLKIAGGILTAIGLGLFGFLVYTIGFYEIIEGIAAFGFVGFGVILLIHLLRITLRSLAWNLCTTEPYRLELKDTVPAVIIGEAMSSTIPLGIMVSGTAKAVAVRNKLPLVAGLSSVATENLFYSLITSLFLVGGGLVLVSGSGLDENLRITMNIVIATVIILLGLGIMMVIRQWHFASWICDWLYEKGWGRHLLKRGRADVREFENTIYGFYRKYPRRFLPICLLQVAYHSLGTMEVFYIINRLSDESESIVHAFLLESVSRLIAIVFKLVPFSIGVDEAGAQIVGKTFALAAGVGVTLAIIRKGRMLFWTAMGLILILKREITFVELASHGGLQRPEDGN